MHDDEWQCPVSLCISALGKSTTTLNLAVLCCKDLKKTFQIVELFYLVRRTRSIMIYTFMLKNLKFESFLTFDLTFEGEKLGSPCIRSSSLKTHLCSVALLWIIEACYTKEVCLSLKHAHLVIWNLEPRLPELLGNPTGRLDAQEWESVQPSFVPGSPLH